jgi:hypothetical protein
VKALSFVGSSLLDPFVKLPIDLTSEERNLLHDCKRGKIIACLLSRLTKRIDLSVVPYSVYRTTGRSAFCPVRDLTLNAIATNEIWLSWAVLLMEYRRSKLRGRNPENDPSFLSRRRLTYKIMNRQIGATEAEMLSDDTVYGLMAAGIAECRIGGEDLSKEHLEAALTLWRMRREKGYQRQYKSPVELVPCDAFISIGVKNHFKTHKALLAASDSTTAGLRDMQTWNVEMRKTIGNRTSSPRGGGQQATPVNDYLVARHDALGPGSALRRYIKLLLVDSANKSMRTCLGILFAVNYTLWACRDGAVGTVYLKELAYYLTKSETRDEQNVPELTATAVMYVVGHCGALQQHRALVGETVFDLWYVVEFVEVLMLAGERTRTKVRDCLASWMLASVEDAAKLSLLSVEEHKLMGLEVREKWARKSSRTPKK